MNNIEKTLKALANRRRLAILKFLYNRQEASVGDIADHIRLSFKATSKHLVILANTDLINREQRSLSVFYHLEANQKPFVRALLSIL